MGYHEFIKDTSFWFLFVCFFKHQVSQKQEQLVTLSCSREAGKDFQQKCRLRFNPPPPTNDSGDQNPMPVRQALALLLGLTLNSTPSGLASSSRH